MKSKTTSVPTKEDTNRAKTKNLIKTTKKMYICRQSSKVLKSFTSKFESLQKVANNEDERKPKNPTLIPTTKDSFSAPRKDHERIGKKVCKSLLIPTEEHFQRPEKKTLKSK